MQTQLIENLVLITGILFLVNWVRSWVTMKQALGSLKLLAQLPRYKDEISGPKLSIIVTACNEEESLKTTIPQILAQTYRSFELILINDRSSDATGATIEFYARRDTRIQSIHIDHLPDGWLGKVNALHKGVEVAAGDYYLFTDADIEFKATAISSAMAYVENENVDHLTVFPFNRGRRSFLMGLLSSAYGILYFNRAKILKVCDPKDKAHIGIGAFNLVKRAAFEKTPGFAWLQMEIIDDFGLGLMLKRSGFRTLVLNGLGSVEMDWYPNLWAMIKGLEKNLFPAIGHYSYRRALINMLVLLGTGTVPLVAFAYTGSWLLGIATLLLQIFIPGVLGVLMRKHTQQNVFVGFLIPLGYLILVFTLARSTYFHYFNKGISWRGTWYSTKELQHGSRVRL